MVTKRRKTANDQTFVNLTHVSWFHKDTLYFSPQQVVPPNFEESSYVVVI